MLIKLCSSFHKVKALKKAMKKVSRQEWCFDTAIPWQAHEAIVSVLKQALGARVSQVAVKHNPIPSWKLNTKYPNPNEQPLVMGLILDPEHALSLIDKGPAANTLEVKVYDFI